MARLWRSVFRGLLLSTLGALALDTGKPEDVGLDGTKLAALMGQLQNAVTTNQLPGAAITIVRGNKVVFENTVGMRDRELGLPMTTDTIVRLLSQVRAHVVSDAAGPWSAMLTPHPD
jgi:CubicO group peptidase (beta-lactamase class C family)